jgi:hypothetical protein
MSRSTTTNPAFCRRRAASAQGHLGARGAPTSSPAARRARRYTRVTGMMHVPAANAMRVVDPTGCGDAYRAGLDLRTDAGHGSGHVRSHRIVDGSSQDRASRPAEPALRLRGVLGAVQAAVWICAEIAGASSSATKKPTIWWAFFLRAVHLPLHWLVGVSEISASFELTAAEAAQMDHLTSRLRRCSGRSVRFAKKKGHPFWGGPLV